METPFQRLQTAQEELMIEQLCHTALNAGKGPSTHSSRGGAPFGVMRPHPKSSLYWEAPLSPEGLLLPLALVDFAEWRAARLEPQPGLQKKRGSPLVNLFSGGAKKKI